MADAEKVEKTSKPEEGNPDPKKPPRGGRKGGTEYPRMPLKTALEYADKLVSKTHTGSQPAATILAGVFNSSGTRGAVRAAALRKYGLLEGEKEAYTATQLARDIDAAAEEQERKSLYRRAVLSDKIFAQLFETFHGDLVTKAKLRQRAQALKVHPDLSEECGDFFIQSAETAGLGVREGEGIRLIASSDAAVPITGEEQPTDDAELNPDEASSSDEVASSDAVAEETAPPPTLNATIGQKSSPPRPRTAADVTVNLTVDSSLDGDKLGKQLELLRRYGLI